VKVNLVAMNVTLVALECCTRIYAAVEAVELYTNSLTKLPTSSLYNL